MEKVQVEQQICNIGKKRHVIFYRIAASLRLLLFLMMAQPTFDNIRALLTGVLGAGEMRLEVTLSQMVLHVLAMVMGWLGAR